LEIATVNVTPTSWRAGFVETVRHFEYPLANASSVGIAQLAALARSRGIKALLTGEGADELFGGYWPHHRSSLIDFVPRRTRLRHMIESARFLGPVGTLRAAAERAVRYERDPPPRLADSRNGFEAAAFEAAEAAYSDHDPSRRRLEAELLSDLSLTLPQLLNRMDKNAMQVSVEARIPYLDPGLVSLAVNLPLEARVGPRSKGVLRDVARRHLPRSIALRPKVFGMLFDAGSWIREAAAPSFLRDGHLRELLQVPLPDWTHLMGAVRASGVPRLWSAEVWCRILIEGQTVEQVERELWPSGP
jgi:asparagine synthase (glutamine-hydrolysing)